MDRETRRRVARFLDDYDHGRIDPSIKLPDFIRAVVNEAIDTLPAAAACLEDGCLAEATWETADGRAYCDEHPSDEVEAWRNRYASLRSRVDGSLQFATMQEFRAAIIDALDADGIKD